MNAQRVGLVLCGAAARGPYQAGALSVLIPALLARHHEPTVLLGTSSGAINAALLTQFADTGAAAGQHVANMWASFGDVFDNPLHSSSTLKLLGRSLVAGTPAEDLVSPVAALLDTTPLHTRAAELFEPDRVLVNLRAGRFATLAVAATTCPTVGAAARSRLFVLGSPPRREELTERAVEVVEVERITIEHLLASAAIPVLFRPQYVPEPRSCRGWYVDGGVRLNSPLQAALAADVDRLVVVSGHSAGLPPMPEPVDEGRPPDMASSMAVALRAVLADALADELQTLGRHNRAVRAGTAAPGSRLVPYLLVAPPDGRLAQLAVDAFRPSVLPSDAYWAIGRLLDVLGDGSGRDELLSLILFDPAYTASQVVLGREHAEQALAAGWREDPPG